MKTALFDYFLPKELIAQKPLKQREKARLLVVDRENGVFKDKIFEDVIEYLEKGDVLVLNDTKVIPARLYGVREKTGARVEFFLVEELEKDIWECLCRPARRVKNGDTFYFGDYLKAEVVQQLEQGRRKIRFFGYQGEFLNVLMKLGNIPLPPYIKTKDVEFDDYQTIFASKPGAVAAPTAGLHFSDSLLSKIRQKGVDIIYVTLHCGLGTFQPVKTEDVEKHKMHSEYYEVSQEAADKINKAKLGGKEVWVVGTTVVRVLETLMKEYGEIRAGQGKTDLFIYPPYEFKIVDHLITNFHLPKSSLLMLVSAFAGYDLTMKAYKYAVSKKYRFFSFGDAMLIL